MVCSPSDLWSTTFVYARILFMDFSSAFNNIIPALLQDKLCQLNVPDSTCRWISDFLFNRKQHVRMGSHVSDTRIISAGSPPGLRSFSPPFLTVNQQLHLQPPICQVPEVYRWHHPHRTNLWWGRWRIQLEIDHLVSWCSQNNLLLNVLKTEMVVDFRKDPTPSSPITHHPVKLHSGHYGVLLVPVLRHHPGSQVGVEHQLHHLQSPAEDVLFAAAKDV